MEIEKKYLVKNLPDLEKYEKIGIEQCYISTSPVIRIRKKTMKESEKYFLTVKGSGKSMREEFELGLSEDQYERLLCKKEGFVIRKNRYLIPLADGHTLELDEFLPDDPENSPMYLAEVEFRDVCDMNSFRKPRMLGREVTDDTRYHNSNMSRYGWESLFSKENGEMEK